MAGIARYQDIDAADLAAFQQGTFGVDARQLDPAYFAWRYDLNPARGTDGPGLWLCRRNDKVVGQQAEIRYDLVVDGESRPSAWAVDLMVDDVWRMRGVGPGLVATQLAEHEVVTGVTQPLEAVKSYLRSGWVDVGVVPLYVRPLVADLLLREAPVSPALRRLAPLASIGLRAADAVAATGLRLGGRFGLEPVDRFDERVDEVWTAAAPHYGMIARRDAASTRWRVDQHPSNVDLQRFYLVRKGRTLGYVALRSEERWGVPSACVVDYLAPPRLVPVLLTLAAQAARRSGAAVLVCATKCEPADRALRATGFVRRGVDVEAPLRLVLHCTGPDTLCDRLSDPARWFVTAADSDMS